MGPSVIFLSIMLLVCLIGLTIQRVQYKKREKDKGVRE